MIKLRNFNDRPALSIALVVFIAAVVFSFYIFQFHEKLSPENSDWGTFGDYIGGILNPLIASFAFYWIIQTYNLQKFELSDTRKILENQNDLLYKQNFESTFFQMMSLLNELIKDLSLTGQPLEDESDNKTPLNFETVTNRECFRKLHAILIKVFLYSHIRGDIVTEDTKQNTYHFYNAKNEKIGQCELSSIVLEINKIYDDFYYEFGYIIGHYFRTIFNILKFIDKASMSDDHKKIYTNLLRAQLSKYELGLLFYNCLNPKYGLNKFLPLVKKYNLLKHLESEVLATNNDRTLWNEILKNINVS